MTLVAFVGLVVCTNIANVVWARWANTNPEGLLALSSRQRYLVLAVAGGISPVWYVVIGAGPHRRGVRRLPPRRPGLPRAGAVVVHPLPRHVAQASLDRLNRGFAKAEIGLVPFFAGSNIVAVLTGIHRTPPVRLAALLAVGIAGRLALMWWLAKTFESQLLDILGFLQRYQWWALGLSVLVVVAVNVRNFRRGAGRSVAPRRG